MKTVSQVGTRLDSSGARCRRIGRGGRLGGRCRRRLGGRLGLARAASSARRARSCPRPSASRRATRSDPCWTRFARGGRRGRGRVARGRRRRGWWAGSTERSSASWSASSWATRWATGSGGRLVGAPVGWAVPDEVGWSARAWARRSSVASSPPDACSRPGPARGGCPTARTDRCSPRRAPRDQPRRSRCSARRRPCRRSRRCPSRRPAAGCSRTGCWRAPRRRGR